jgi:hypothetical protein
MRNAIMLLLCVVGVMTSSCTRPPSYALTGTVKDIMQSMVDPNADVVWNAVATVTTEEGMIDRVPQNDQEWQTVRHGALTVVEATNLLIMPGRQVARPGERSDNPKIELHPEEIQALIAHDPDTWRRLARGLHDAGVTAIEAIDRRDPQAVFDAGEGIDNACENCHLTYWYPKAAKK